jgi:hypothetical protein
MITENGIQLFYNFDVAVSAMGFIAAAKVLVRVGLYGSRSLFAK